MFKKASTANTCRQPVHTNAEKFESAQIAGEASERKSCSDLGLEIQSYFAVAVQPHSADLVPQPRFRVWPKTVSKTKRETMS